LRKYDFGAPSVETVFTRAVTVQADDPKLSAEMTEVPSGNTMFHSIRKEGYTSLNH
jgi:hypothetical protein